MAGLRKTTATLLEDLGLKNAQTRIEFSGDLTITLHLLATGRYLAILPNFLMRHSTIRGVSFACTPRLLVSARVCPLVAQGHGIQRTSTAFATALLFIVKTI